MARKTPHIIDGIYHYYDEHEQRMTQEYDITEQWDRWQADLKTLRGFRVTVGEMTFSCYRQKHPNSPRGFWIAVKKRGLRRKTKYIGRDQNMTVEKLAEVASVVKE